jgi:hypothetical protein
MGWGLANNRDTSTLLTCPSHLFGIEVLVMRLGGSNMCVYVVVLSALARFQITGKMRKVVPALNEIPRHEDEWGVEV